MKRSPYYPLFILFIFVAIVWILAGITAYQLFDSWGERGTFGDMFGAINALFSGLAFAGVIYAIFLQRKELELQREELVLTRKELRKSASAQSNQVEQMKKSAYISILSSALNAYCQTVSSSNPGATTYVKAAEKRNELLLKIESFEKELEIT